MTGIIIISLLIISEKEEYSLTHLKKNWTKFIKERINNMSYIKLIDKEIQKCTKQITENTLIFWKWVPSNFLIKKTAVLK